MKSNTKMVKTSGAGRPRRNTKGFVTIEFHLMLTSNNTQHTCYYLGGVDWVTNTLPPKDHSELLQSVDLEDTSTMRESGDSPNRGGLVPVRFAPEVRAIVCVLLLQVLIVTLSCMSPNTDLLLPSRIGNRFFWMLSGIQREIRALPEEREGFPLDL